MAVGATWRARATNDWGLDLLLALPLAGVAGLVAAVLVGLPALRVKGLFLAVTTLGFGWPRRPGCSTRASSTGSPPGASSAPTCSATSTSTARRASTTSAWPCWCWCSSGSAASAQPHRRVLLAMRENERASAGLRRERGARQAHRVRHLRLRVGRRRRLFIHHQQAFDEGAFGPGLSIVLFTAAVIGGLGSLTGGSSARSTRGGVLPAAGRLALLQLGRRRALRAARDARRPRLGPVPRPRRVPALGRATTGDHRAVAARRPAGRGGRRGPSPKRSRRSSSSSSSEEYA